MQKRILVFLPILFADITPIAGCMPPQILTRLFTRLVKGSKSAGCGDDLTEIEPAWQLSYALFLETAAV